MLNFLTENHLTYQLRLPLLLVRAYCSILAVSLSIDSLRSIINWQADSVCSWRLSEDVEVSEFSRFNGSQRNNSLNNNNNEQLMYRFNQQII